MFGAFLDIIFDVVFLFSFGVWSNNFREMAVGNTFGATSFCSYGAYWITFALISDFDPVDSAKDTSGTCQNETLMGLFMLVSRSLWIDSRQF
jgi:succinate-acetate transporter protein